MLLEIIIDTIQEIGLVIKDAVAKHNAWRAFKYFPQDEQDAINEFISMLDCGYDCSRIVAIASRYTPDGYNDYIYYLDCILRYMEYRKNGLTDEKAIVCLNLDAMFKRVRKENVCT